MEKKVTDEMMEKETGIFDVVKDSSASDSIQIERVDQTLIDENKLSAESKKESPVEVVEEVADVEKSEESAEKEKDESSEKEPTEMVLIVEEVNVESFDEEKAEKKETMEDVDEEVKEEKYAETAEKKDVKIVNVSESTDKAGGKHEDEIKDVEPVSSAETTDVKFLEVESKPEASQAKESASEVEVKAEENSETEEEAEAELHVKVEEKSVETKCPEEVVLISQDLVYEPKKESEEVSYSSLTDFIEKMGIEAKHVVEEPSKDVTNKLVEEDEGIKEDTLRQTDIESNEKAIAAKSQEEMTAEKAAEGLQTEPDVKESGEGKQESEVTEKEFSVKPKHSSNIISKVKQSLVKAKKAVTGK
ncbi:hypothetical protein EUTSA_v10004472mg [Eutrema salsugineum]|uniref:Uncharacterized protein n=1 Tax=Eutrema salsugineum TaxID=72664 RepID=V4KLS8_EUTSA|nr:neurofilament medium polypeptide [Eutrema salsugineum]ESQ32184.1 hypothetical protein EUTSA_v10004472mg [Eutrema salsugineum]